MSRAPTICNEPDCPAVVHTGNRCPAHQAAGHNRHGSTRAWRQLREQVLARDHWTCQYCGQPASEPDHVLARANGGPDTAANLVASCRTCNLAKGSAAPGPPPESRQSAHPSVNATRSSAVNGNHEPAGKCQGGQPSPHPGGPSRESTNRADTPPRPRSVYGSSKAWL